MSFSRYLITFGMLMLLLALPTMVFGQTQGVAWRSNLDAAKVEAAESGKLLLLHFWSPTCGPCRNLDQAVFPMPQVAQAVERGFVPVKINTAISPAMAQAFRIDRVPTDIILTSQGNVVANLSCPPTPDAYAAQLSNLSNHYGISATNLASYQANAGVPQQVNSAYAQLGAQVSRPAANAPLNQYPGAVAANTQPAAPTTPSNPTASPATAPAVPSNTMPQSYRNPYAQGYPQNVATTAPNSATKSQPGVTPPPVQANTPDASPAAGVYANAYADHTQEQTTSAPVEHAAPALANQPAGRPVQPVASASQKLPAGSPPLGFDGNCPVTLKSARKWVRGDAQFGAIHRGRTYLFVGEKERQQFLADPDAYSPVFSGMDPVLKLDQQRTVEGSRKYGFEYRGAFYLFSSQETMQKFAADPDQYAASVRQAMHRLDGTPGTIRR